MKKQPQCKPPLLLCLLLQVVPANRVTLADTNTDTAVADAAAGAGDALQEVTVVAQKQNIGLQHAPVALTAITADSMKQAAIIPRSI